MGGSPRFHPGCGQHSVEVLLMFGIRMLGKIEDRREGDKKDEMVGWHPRLNGHEFAHTPGDSGGQGSLSM